VNTVFRVEGWADQCSKGQEGSFTKARLVSDLYLGALSRQHPGRNLQALPGRVNDADRPIVPLGPADDLQSSTVERVKGVEDLNVQTIRAQGIVGVGATADSVPTCAGC
jgi:hypothetical protein